MMLSRRGFLKSLLATSVLVVLPPVLTRTVEAKLREFINVLNYGADPTGATDSTAAFQAAMEAASLPPTEASVIYVPAGDYDIKALPTKANLLIRGER